MKQKSYETKPMKESSIVIRGKVDYAHLPNPMHADIQRRFRSCKWQDKRHKQPRYKERYE